jgi:hypothetical protein
VRYPERVNQKEDAVLELNRDQVHKELLAALSSYRRLIDAATPARLRQRTDGTRWTNQEMPHSTQFSGKKYHRSSKASRREDLQVEHPILCRDCSAFHFHSTLAGMLSASLVGREVIQVGEPREKRLLAPARMVKPFHREQFPLDGIVRLI